jgi:hypothetical protein
MSAHMPQGAMQWDVPVVVSASSQRRMLRVVISDGEVVLIPPPGAGFILPASSDAALADAIEQARDVAMQMGQA